MNAAHAISTTDLSTTFSVLEKLINTNTYVFHAHINLQGTLTIVAELLAHRLVTEREPK